MTLFTRVILCMVFMASVTAVATEVDVYKFVAGGTALGARENNKRTVELGFSTVLNEVLISKKIQCEFEFFESSVDLAHAIKEGQVQAFFGSSLEFLSMEHLLQTNGLLSAIGGESVTRLVLMVRHDSGINSLQQLKGKRLVSYDWVMRDLGGIYLETLLLESKLPVAKAYFSEIKATDSTNRAVIDLFFKKADVALVSKSQFNIVAELNPQIHEQVRVLEESEEYPTLVIAASKSLPSKQRDILLNALFKLHTQSKPKKMLRLIKLEKIIKLDSSVLDNVRTLIKKNKLLKSTRKR